MTNEKLHGELGETRDINRVAVDVEGVLAATHPRLCEVYNERHNADYSPTDINDWDWVVEEIDFMEFMNIVDTAWREGNCGASISMWDDPAAVSASIDRLSNRFDIDVVTARNGVDQAIQTWLADHGIEYESFHSISHTESKAPLEYDVYIDDKPGLANELTSTQVQYLVKRPWNRTGWKHGRTIAVDSVIEATNRLLES